MKRIISTILFLTIVFGVQAQEKEYNHWSVDGRFGLNHPVKSISMSTGYETASPLSPFTVGLGFRYMLNDRFGLRFGVDYNDFKNSKDSKKFKSQTVDINLQAVSNLGKILDFESWTKRFGLLTHAGIGVGVLEGDGLGEDNDRFGSVDFGLTPQFRVNNRFALYLDLSLQMNVKQQTNFDTYGKNHNIGFQGFNYMATLGLNVYLGKDRVHADWLFDRSEKEDLFKKQVDSLRVQVADLVKAVDTNRKSITENTAAVKELKENSKKYVLITDLEKIRTAKTDVASELIMNGYMNVYFGFNESQPKTYSLWAVDFIKKYMEKNPDVVIQVVGYADEIGADNYNQELSNERANVVKRLLEKAGIAAERVSAVGEGEDKSVDKNSKNARRMARRVTFRIKELIK